MNAGMRSSQCVCSREDDNLQLRHIQLISFPGFLSFGNWDGEHTENRASVWAAYVCATGKKRPDLTGSQTTWRWSHYLKTLSAAAGLDCEKPEARALCATAGAVSYWGSMKVLEL